jgi:lysophospholipase L1-like esterase
MNDENYKEYLHPYWKSDLMINESLMMYSTDDNLPVARLLNAPAKFISLRNSFLDTIYEEGKDFTISDDLIYLTENSRAASASDNDFYAVEQSKGIARSETRNSYLLLQPRDKRCMHELQLAATYLHNAESFADYSAPVFASEFLPATISKLTQGKSLKMVLYGDSIAAGANSSGFDRLPPFLPTWSSLMEARLRIEYKRSEINIHNPSQGGKSSDWGRDNAKELVAKLIPDLVIIAFGMGDAHTKNYFDPKFTQANISSIIDDVRSLSPGAEFILVTPMMANPEAKGFAGRQAEYTSALYELQGKGVAVADVNSIHQILLDRKGFLSLGGNSVNHPNDFIVRLYAQVVLSLIIEDL